MNLIISDVDYEPIRSSIDIIPADHLNSPDSRIGYDSEEEDTRRSRVSVCVPVNEEEQLSKHAHLPAAEDPICNEKKTLGRKLLKYARSMRGSMHYTSFMSRSQSRIKTGKLEKEDKDIELAMRRLFRTKRRLEGAYISFCAITVLIGLLAMTLYDHITAYMFGIWVICALMDVTIVAGSMFYANRRLNQIEDEYPNRNVKEEWAAILEHELGH